MVKPPSSEVTSLKRLAVFDDLPDAVTAKVALLAKSVTLAKDETLKVAEDPDAPFYMVLEGKVELNQTLAQRKQRVYVMNPGEFFGASAILYGRSRAMLVTALEPTRLIKLEARLIRVLLQQEPELQSNLRDASIMYNRLHGGHFNWIAPDETVQEIIHEHPVYLLVGIAKAAGLGLVGLALLLAGPFMGSIALGTFFEAAGALVLLAAAGWGVWEYVDWDNDYYVVTDRRIAWVERILWLYDSRDEILLSEVRSVEPETTFLGRILKYANLYIVDNFQRRVVFRHIRHHLEVKRVIEALTADAKKRQSQLDQVVVESTMRSWIAPPPPPASAKPASAAADQKKPPIPVRLQEYFDFRMRIVQGNTVIYRHHVFSLLMKQLPAILTGLFFVFTTALLVNTRLANPAGFPSVPTSMLLGLTGLVGAFLWGMYHFEDWRNDTYEITPDKIIVRQKRPLDIDRRSELVLLVEEREEVIGLQYRRGSVLKVLLNYGDVLLTVKIPGETQVRQIKNVYDPPQVHQDIFDRIYVKKRKKAQDDLVKTGQLKDWFAAYHRLENRNLNSPDSGVK